MNYRYYFFFVLIAMISFSCNNPSSSHTPDDVVSSDTIIEVEKDTTEVKAKTEFSAKDVENWTVDDFVIKKPEDFKKEELTRVMNQTIETWATVENPLTLVYKGVEMGDYYHVSFDDQKNNAHYDFGSGDNNFEDYQIMNDFDETNPKYLDQTFKVTWAWKASYFLCCSGGMNSINAYQPSVVKMELVGDEK
jgi:hypothetical protein